MLVAYTRNCKCTTDRGEIWRGRFRNFFAFYLSLVHKNRESEREKEAEREREREREKRREKEIGL